MDFLARKKASAFGVDISSTTIKLLELKKQGRGHYQVAHCAVEPLPHSAVKEQRIADSHAVSLALQRALQQSGTKNHHAVIAMPDSATITKTIQMPGSLSSRDLENVVELEAAQHIPFPLTEVYFDFDVIGSSQAADKMDILLAAARKENLHECQTALESAGIQAQIVDIESLAIGRACRALLPGSNHDQLAVIDLGADTTNAYVLQQDQLVFSHTEDFADEHISQEIRSYCKSAQPMLAASHQSSNHSEREASDLLHTLKRSILQQINRMIQIHAATNPSSKPRFWILTGDCILLPGIIQAVREQMTVPIITINPFRDSMTAENRHFAQIQRYAPAMLVAYSLALRGLDDPH